MSESDKQQQVKQDIEQHHSSLSELNDSIKSNLKEEQINEIFENSQQQLQEEQDNVSSNENILKENKKRKQQNEDSELEPNIQKKQKQSSDNSDSDLNSVNEDLEENSGDIYYSESEQEESSCESDQSKELEEFTYDQLIEGMKKKEFKKAVFLTGAGISVSAGIPDFRTPGTGLFSQLRKCGMKNPMSIFDLNYFKQNPYPFYMLSKEFLKSGMHPTISHHFISQFEKQEQLGLVVTQNIDGLELEAGISKENLIQAHGHFRTAHCINKECKKEFDVELFNEKARNDEILVCDCGAFVKPDIVFYYESVDDQMFNKGFQYILDADIVFIMGTTLKVSPFNFLAAFIPDECPLVLMNMENALKNLGIRKNKFLFLQGDIDDNVTKIMKDMNWDIPEIQKVEVQIIKTGISNQDEGIDDEEEENSENDWESENSITSLQDKNNSCKQNKNKNDIQEDDSGAKCDNNISQQSSILQQSEQQN